MPAYGYRSEDLRELNATGIDPHFLAEMKIGGVLDFSAHGRNFRLIHLHARVWHLCDLAITERSRFGTRKQIAEDIAYVVANGVLPPVTDPRW